MVLLLLFVVLTTAAEEPLRLRNCRPQLERKGVPERCKTARRATEANPMIGDRRQLVVLVDFSDQKFKDADPQNLWGKVFNAENYVKGSFVGSVHDYFYAQSYGQLNLTFDLFYVPLGESRIKYHSTDIDDENSKYLVNDIVDVLQTQDIDWEHYDWNGDGYVNQLLIVYAGKGQNAGGDSNTIWPHQWWLSQHEDGQARTVSQDGKDYLVDCYCCVQELYSNNTYGTFGTICHEYSHCFGLPDFYNGSNQYVGSWDLMDYGNNNQNGFCPPNYSAHERMLMGWLIPTELTTTTMITGMSATGQQPEAYIIRNDGHPNEFYLVENRQQTGWDKALPGNGLVVFHVDYDEEVWANSTPNSGWRKRYTIIPANNRTSSYFSYGWAYPFGDNDLLTDESSPVASLLNQNTDGSYLMHKPLTDITVEGGLASFHFMEGGTSIREFHSDSRQAETLYHHNRFYIIRYANGEVRKVLR